MGVAIPVGSGAYAVPMMYHERDETRLLSPERDLPGRCAVSCGFTAVGLRNCALRGRSSPWLVVSSGGVRSHREDRVGGIGEQFSAARTARALYTHRNTVLNRLQRPNSCSRSRSPGAGW